MIALDEAQTLEGLARTCSWCRRPLPTGARRDAQVCSKRCRQARHRFTSAVGTASSPVVGGQPRRLAYADPPYPGKSRRYYGDHADFAGEVDHRALIDWLAGENDAWALSTSAEALPRVLALCPAGVRVAAWHRGFIPNQAALAPLNAWEPVIYGGQILTRRAVPARRDASPTNTTDPSQTPEPSYVDERQIGVPGPVAPSSSADPSCGDRRQVEAVSPGSATERVDSLTYKAAPRLTDPNRVMGAKPAEFCRWVFDLLAATTADALVDVFPGSGGVSRAWETYTGKPAIRGDRAW